MNSLSQIVVGVRIAITKRNGERVAGTVKKVHLATRAQGLRFVIERVASDDTTVVEAVDIAEFFLF